MWPICSSSLVTKAFVVFCVLCSGSRNTKDMQQPVKWTATSKFRMVSGQACLTLLSAEPPMFQWSASGCYQELSVLSLSCSFLDKRAARHMGERLLNLANLSDIGAECAVSPTLFPSICLQPRSAVRPGEMFGLGPCKTEIMSNLMFSLISKGSVLHAKKDAAKEIGRNNELCLTRSSDGNALEALDCTETLVTHPRFVSLVELDGRDPVESSFELKIMNLPAPTTDRCRSQFLHLNKEARLYGSRLVKSFLPLQHACPKPNVKQKGSPLSDKIGIVYQFRLHDAPEDVLRIAEDLLDSRYGLRSFFVFHVDASTSEEVHVKVKDFCEAHRKIARFVDPPIDVEWGAMSEVFAQYRAIKLAHKTWPKMWDNIVLLTGSDVPTASFNFTNSFWQRNAGLNGFFRVHERSSMDYDLNALIGRCGRESVFLGVRLHSLYTQNVIKKGGKLWSAQTYFFLGYQFVEYIVTSAKHNLKALKDLTRFMSFGNEIFWPTLFFNSPLCGQAADVEADEFMMTSWPVKEEELSSPFCSRVLFENPVATCGQSPLWLRDSDAGVLTMYPEALFARKASQRRCPGLIFTVRSWIKKEVKRSELLFNANFRFQIKTGSACIAVLSANPPYPSQWSTAACANEVSLLRARCSTGAPTGLKDLSSPVGLADADAVCLISPVSFPNLCLQLPRNEDASVGTPLGFGSCHDIGKAKQIFRFIRSFFSSALQVAGPAPEVVYGANDVRGLCIFKSGRQQFLLEARPCKTIVPANPNVVEVKKISGNIEL